MENKLLAQVDFNKLNQELSGKGFKFANTSLGYVIDSLMNYLFVFAGLALLGYLIYGGFLLMTSGGEPKKVQAGTGVVTNAILGFLIMFAAYWITQIVAKIFGLDSLGVFN